MCERYLLKYFEEWDEQFAHLISADRHLPDGLTENHWQTIQFLRNYYTATYTIPLMYEVCLYTILLCKISIPFIQKETAVAPVQWRVCLFSPDSKFPTQRSKPFLWTPSQKFANSPLKPHSCDPGTPI